MWGKPNRHQGSKERGLGLRVEGKPKSSLMYMVRCALILHIFVIKHFSSFETDLIIVVSQTMLQ